MARFEDKDWAAAVAAAAGHENGVYDSVKVLMQVRTFNTPMGKRVVEQPYRCYTRTAAMPRYINMPFVCCHALRPCTGTADTLLLRGSG
jgi:hypothetical protein